MLRDATTPNIVLNFWPVSNFAQQLSTTRNRVYKRTQRVTSDNVGSCWPTILRPFARGLKSTHRGKLLSIRERENIIALWSRLFYGQLSHFRPYLSTNQHTRNRWTALVIHLSIFRTCIVLSLFKNMNFHSFTFFGCIANLTAWPAPNLLNSWRKSLVRMLSKPEFFLS